MGFARIHYKVPTGLTTTLAMAGAGWLMESSMHVTERLVRLFRVDQQLRGLTSRLTSAERFLVEQAAALEKIDKQRKELDSQLKQLTVDAMNHEGEMKRVDEKMNKIRTQMETAQTNREYKAFLTEMNTFKADRDESESKAIESMQKIDGIKAKIVELDGQRADRNKMHTVAVTDREARASEIQTRLDELKAQRADLATKFTPADKDSVAVYTRLVQQRGDEAMATVEVHDRKRHEYTCGSCQMSIPIEAVNGLLTSGRLTRCVSCQCILFLDEEANTILTTPVAGKREKGEKPEKASKTPKVAKVAKVES